MRRNFVYAFAICVLECETEEERQILGLCRYKRGEMGAISM